MIEYATTVIPENKAICREALELLALVFGKEESLLEAEQLDGYETACSTDVLFTAKEDGVLLGTCHLTVPHAFPRLGGASGLCTSMQARGKGIGKKLFGMMVEESDSRGVDTVFLGTSNPVAAAMYAQFGYSFLTGSNVMARSTGRSLLDFYRTYYSPGPATCQKGDASFRIPVIPLVLARGRDMLMDANTSIFSSAVLTQPSCMGLFPRYLDLERKGGAYYGARLASGAICALSSVLPTSLGNRVDAFAFPGFEKELLDLLSLCEAQHKDCYAEVVEADAAKAEMFASLGYRPDAMVDHLVNSLRVPCRIWQKK